MKLACVLLSAWAAAAAASKQPGRSSSTFNFEDGSRLETSRKTPPDVRSVYCDPKTEETCYDDSYNAVSCSLISEGGCPCPDDLFRCGADLANGCVGWCTDVCCEDWATEYVCYPLKVCAKYDGDGCPCPEDQQECWTGSGVCSSVCCDSDEESCYGPDGYTVSSCAKIADGGCPCPDGQKKCGADLAYNYTGWCQMECCDDATQETCYEYKDDVFTKQYCKSISEGGCPCPDGQKKCGADPAYNYTGWCQMECCDDATQETCYEYKDDVFTKQYCKSISEGGCPCPTGQTKCGADLTTNYPGYCTDVCCDFIEQETCYDPPSCAPISSGGCPCPTGQTKCGADPKISYAGYCTNVCCNTTQELCYNYTRCVDNEYCAEIADGGCPCPEGLTRCGADLDNNIVGVCDYICCDTTTQETCYAWDDNGNIIPSCAAIADGGCPCPDGYEKCGADLNNGIAGYCSDICCNAASHETCYDWARGTYEPYCAEIAVGGCPKRSGAVSYLQHLETRNEKLPAFSRDKDSFLEKFALEQKIAALRHSIKLDAAPAQLSMDKNPEQYMREES